MLVCTSRTPTGLTCKSFIRGERRRSPVSGQRFCRRQASDHRGISMCYRSSTGAFALAAVLTLSIIGAQAFDETKYPNWKGQWVQLGGNQGSPWDPTKPPGTGQQAPLTREYQAIFEASVKSAADGGPGPDPTARCIPAGVPRAMIAAQPLEIVITPDATYFMLEESST